MKKYKSIFSLLVFVILIYSCNEQATKNVDPLPSWNDGAAKQSIVDFVDEVTNEASPNFVKPADRIATFDNDGTLWSEQPYYFQFQLAFDRVKEMAADHPEWNDNPLFKAALESDMSAVMKSVWL